MGRETAPPEGEEDMEKTVEQELKAKAGEHAENGPVQVTTAAAEETETVEAQAGAEAQTEAEPTGLYQPVTLLFAGDVYFSNYVRTPTTGPVISAVYWMMESARRLRMRISLW